MNFYDNFIVNFENISQIFSTVSIVALNRSMFAGPAQVFWRTFLKNVWEIPRIYSRQDTFLCS